MTLSRKMVPEVIHKTGPDPDPLSQPYLRTNGPIPPPSDSAKKAETITLEHKIGSDRFNS